MLAHFQPRARPVVILLWALSTLYAPTPGNCFCFFIISAKKLECLPFDMKNLGWLSWVELYDFSV